MLKQVDNRLFEPHRGPKVQVEDVANVDEILLPKGQIQPHLLFQGRNSLGGRLIPQDVLCGIPGDQPDSQKDDDGDDNQHRDHLEDPF